MVDPDALFGRLGNRMFQMAYIYAQMKKGVIPDLYLQDVKYFQGVIEEIKELFGEGITRNTPYVSIHLRRGDYVNNSFYVDLSKTDYYQKAIALFPDSSFLVFSDDTVFAKQMFKGIYDEDRFTIVEGKSEIEDLNTMASCEHQIIANSSFSLWAGILNPNPDKKVIAPKEWFTDKVERVGFPKDWIQL